jgi:[lysine-biosynthesis-protein LysW]--L-2-aminoadipate ligase
MSPPLVGVFGEESDDETRVLAGRVRARGAECWVVDLGALPARSRLRWGSDGPTIDARPLAAMDAAYLRRIGRNLPSHLAYAQAGDASGGAGWPSLRAETVSALRGELRSHAARTALVQWLAQRRAVVNPPQPQNLHRMKVRLLGMLAARGVPVPPFVAGAPARAVAASTRDAVSRWGEAVDKPLAGIYKTRAWSDLEAPARGDARPALLQRRVRGDTVRCYVLDGRVLASARIVHAGTVDSSESQTGIDPTDLPDAARRAALDAAATVGVAFCGLDLMRASASGEWFVIDCNLSPMFVRFGVLSGCDVAGALADYLVDQAARRTGPRRPGGSRRGDRARIAILGRKIDAEVVALHAALAALGVEPLVVDFHNFPRFNLACLGERARFDDAHVPAPIDLGALEAVHVRSACYDPWPDADDTDPGSRARLGRHGREQVAKLAFQASLASLLARRAAVLNPPAAFRFHREKGYQHALLRRHGIPTPEALVATDLEAARCFAASLGFRAVSKPLTGGAEVVVANDSYFAGCARARRSGPWMIQRLVRGRSVRMHLFGGEVASAAEILHDGARVDWRERTLGTAPFEPDAALAALAGRAVRLLDMPICGMDVEIDSATGRAYVLDLNPSALFVGYSRLTGIDMAARLARYLVSVVEHGGDAWFAAGARDDG